MESNQWQCVDMIMFSRLGATVFRLVNMFRLNLIYHSHEESDS